MKKSYTMFVMMLLTMLGAMTASAQDNLVELDETMFKAWNSAGGDAVALDLSDEDNLKFRDGEETFGCEVNYFKNVDGGNVIYGNGNVIWQWYADLSRVKKMYFTGEKGLGFRVLYNRQPMQEGDTDPHGHACPETTVTIGDDGTAVLDVEEFMQTNNLEYFHINCLKISWGAQALKFKKVMLEGDIEGSGKVYSPLDGMTGGFQANVASINLGPNTNLLTLLNGKERILFPTANGTVKINGTAVDLMSVEGMMVDGNARILFFMSDYVIDDTENETADVKLSFTNPDDEAQRLVFNVGRFEDEALPNITDMVATFEDHVGEFYPNLAKIPEVDSASPELNSINLPVGMTEFKITLTGNADLSQIIAKFDDQNMTVSPNTGYGNEITLTRPAGDVEAGIHTISIENLIPEMDWFGEQGSATLKYSFGITDLTEGIETLMTDGFAESGNGTVPAAWNVTSDSEVRTDGSYALGCRVITLTDSFAENVLYLCSRNTSGGGYANYGLNDQKLTLEPKTYHLTYEAARWDGSGTRGLKVQVVTEEKRDGENNIIGGGEVLAEQLTQVNTDRNVKGQCNKGDLVFTVTETSNVVLKFFPCNASGNPDGYGDALAIANIKVQYIPDNIMGIELLQALKDALQTANTAKESAEGERYSGTIYNTLATAITKYTTTPPTAPSSFDAVVKELNDDAAAMDKHRTLCDDFDKLPADLLVNLDKYAGTKFASQKIYTDLQDAFNKYATVSEEPVENEGVITTVRTAVPNLITDDAQLQAGIDEMNKVNGNVSMFSEGKSQNGTTGYAALHERLRVGVETALAVGLTESNAAVAAANKELGDNDAVAKKLQFEITKKLYANLTENASIEEPIDMTVFIKNPNIYVTKANNTDFSDAMAPGWSIAGSSISGNWGTNGGGGHVATDEVPADEALTLSSDVVVSQQITNLPAGVYQVIAYMGERRGDSDFTGLGEGETDEEKLADARAKVFPKEFVFINTSATEEGAYDNQTPVASNGTSWGATDNNRIVSQEFTVTDGKVTIGVNNTNPGWFAFNEIHLSFVAPAPGFDYSKFATPGDVNDDSKVSVADANLVVNYYLADEVGKAEMVQNGFNTDAADINGDSTISISDANMIVNTYLEE